MFFSAASVGLSIDMGGGGVLIFSVTIAFWRILWIARCWHSRDGGIGRKVRHTDYVHTLRVADFNSNPGVAGNGSSSSKAFLALSAALLGISSPLVLLATLGCCPRRRKSTCCYNGSWHLLTYYLPISLVMARLEADRPSINPSDSFSFKYVKQSLTSIHVVLVFIVR